MENFIPGLEISSALKFGRFIRAQNLTKMNALVRSAAQMPKSGR
jgi:hypothetical protein